MFTTTLAVVALAQANASEMKLLRYPAVHGDSVAFVYGGDIWTSGLNGTLARRLTTSPGSESWPRFSPDGKWIAFSGQYDSALPAVYVMPAEGGSPKRLTFEPAPCNVTGWTPDGKVTYASSYGSPFTGRLWKVSPEGGMPERTDLGEYTNGSYSPDGGTIVYNRNNSYAFNWRRYRGGTQGKLSFYDFGARKYWEAQTGRENSYWPMWVGEKVYYLSDKTENNVNIWVYDTKSKSAKQLTQFNDGDIKNPSTDGQTIVFERNGALSVFDIASGQVKEASVRVASDETMARPRYRRFQDSVSGLDISPSGKRLIVEARGDLYSVPAKNGETRNLTNSSKAREQNPSWSVDGQSVYFLSDKSGENRIYQMPQMGGDAKEINTPKGQVIRGFNFSPDGKKLSYVTVDNSLYVFDLASGSNDKVYTEMANGVSFDWSPDSNWIAYNQTQKNLFAAVYLYNVKDKTSTKVTEGYYNDSGVAFDLNGKYLYLISGRTYGVNQGAFEIGLFQNDVQRVYAMILSKDQTNPLFPPSDEEPVKGEGAAKEEPKKDEAVKIDFDGLDQRMIALPWAPGSYGFVIGADGGVFTIAGGSLVKFDMESRAPQTIISGVGQLAFNAKRTKFAYSAAGVVGIADVRPGVDPAAGKVPLTDVATNWVPRDEWTQIFWESWRHERDNYYDPEMLGLDWKAIGDKYAALLPYCSNRSDLTYLIGLMLGELGTGHSYTQPGETGYTAPNVPVGMLGADFEVSGQKVQFKKVYKGLNFESDRRGPLGAPGVNVNDGDYLVAINGIPVKSSQSVSELLTDKVDKPVTLTVSSRPSFDVTRKVVVRPIASEQGLRYIEWVEANRAYVKKVSGGKIGYLHVPNTNVQGIIEFMKGYYSNSDAEAFVIDERYNGGGWIPTFFIEYLMRNPQTVFKPRYGLDVNLPNQTLFGPKCMLINEFAGSGGDMFPWLFKKNKIGPLIGTRTWGGLVGINGYSNAVDGGGVSAPAFGIYDREKGEWIAENKGVDPDIEVDARPDLVAQGKDPVLDKAIEYLNGELKKFKRDHPVPDFPKIKKG